MDKERAIDELCAHIEEWWQFYATINPHAFIMLIDGRWHWCPLYNDSYQLDDLYSYTDTLRAFVQRFKATAVAFAARESGNEESPRFFAGIEFRDDPQTRSIVWDIAGNQLANPRMMVHEPRDDADDDMDIFAPPEPMPPAWHADAFVLLENESKYTEVLWQRLVQMIVRMMLGP